MVEFLLWSVMFVYLFVILNSFSLLPSPYQSFLKDLLAQHKKDVSSSKLDEYTHAMVTVASWATQGPSFNCGSFLKCCNHENIHATMTENIWNIILVQTCYVNSCFKLFLCCCVRMLRLNILRKPCSTETERRRHLWFLVDWLSLFWETSAQVWDRLLQ